MKVRNLVFGLIALALALAIHSSAWAAACTCTYSTATSTTATVRGQWVNCGTATTACTLTDGMFNNGITYAKHLELNNDCAHTVTVAVNGSAAVIAKGDVLLSGQHQVYDILNGPCANAQPGPTCSNELPHGTFSIINSTGSDSGCFNVYQY